MVQKKIIVNENTYLGWKDVFEQYNREREETNAKSELVEFIFSVSMDNDVAKETNDVTNLKFFMPIVHEIEKKENYIWRLEVLLPAEDYNDGVGRVCAFLCLVFPYVDNVKNVVYAFGEKKFNPFDIEKFKAKLDDARSKGRLNNFSEQELREVQKILSNTYIRECNQSNLFIFAYPWKDCSVFEKKALEENEQKIQEKINKRAFEYHKKIKSILNEVLETPIEIALYVIYNKKIVSSNIFPCLCFTSEREQEQDKRGTVYKVLDQKYNQDSSMYGQLPKIITALEEYLEDDVKYVGLSGVKLSKDNKKDLREELRNRLHDYIKEINVLTYIVLLYIVRNLIKQKQIFKVIEENKKNKSVKNMHIDEIVLRKAVADAASYAESIYQIVENSCLHSYGRRAYFGMRIHNASRHATMTNYEEESKILLRLYNKYSDCLDLNKNGQIIGDKNEFNNSDYDDFIEFFVVDNASNQEGILSHYNQRNEAVKCIEEIIEKPLTSLEDYIQHYGLRWFRKIIKKNHGHFIVRSPYKHSDGVYEACCWRDNGENSYWCRRKNHEKNEGKAIGEKLYVTDYNILVPLEYRDKQDILFDEKRKISVHKIFGDKVELEDFHLQIFDCNQIKNIPLKQTVSGEYKKKEDLVKELIDKYPRFFQKNTVLLLDATNCSYSEVELIAKSLFGFIYQRRGEGTRYFAVDFGENKELITEFVRIFSIFYDKDEKNSILKDIQIALCADSLENEPFNNMSRTKEISFILAGKDLRSVYATANVFLYYNSGNTLRFIPLLKYLVTDVAKKNSDSTEESLIPENQFPFDLFLSKKAQVGDKKLTMWKDSWFLDKIDNALNANMESKKLYGCKLDEVHVRLHSGIHINCFYEAELLFHNIGNIYRFAYLLARDIIKDIRARYINSNHKNIVLCSYENYSSVLLQQVCEIIQAELEDLPISIEAYIGSAEDDQKITIYECYKKGVPYTSQDSDCYTIIPIGMTLSTIYKMNKSIEAHFKDTKERTLKFCKNYSLIVVGDDGSKEENQLESAGLLKKYWKEIDVDKKKIVLTPYDAQNKSFNNAEVYYLLKVNATWHGYEECANQHNETECSKEWKPLMHLDKTSTQPKFIFDLDNNNRKKIYGYANLDKFSPEMFWDGEYEPIMLYSHLYRGGNHYQFYFRFLEFVKKNEQDIQKWAIELAKKVEQDAYNIVLAPLNISNSVFLKLVIDRVFSSSLRLLHIPIDESYKEEIRTKFSYIAEEYKRIKSLNKNAKINFYYIDDSIVMGHTLNRARMFLRMLLDESGIEYNGIKIFKKLFLLINRSSYDTLNTFVDNPQENVHAFSSIDIPSYNTSSDYCPACEVKERFELLRKRSNTEAMRREFDRLSCKHKKRTPKEYLVWQNEEIFDNPSYFAWLRLFLYHWTPEYEENEKDISNIKLIKGQVEAYLKAQFDKKEITNLMVEGENLEELRQVFNAKISKLTIGDTVKDLGEPYQTKVANLMKYLIEQRAYRRFVAMNKAYQGLLFSSRDERNRQEREKTIRKTIIALIKQEFDSIHANEMSKTAFYEKAEILMSYIKVISREQLANYYTIRKVIIGILKEILKAMLDQKEEPDLKPITKFLRFSKEIGRTADNNLCAALQLQIYFTIIHRLAMLQCEEAFEEKTIERTVKQYDKIYNKYFFVSTSAEKYNGYSEDEKIESLLMTNLPSFELLIEKYVASIKVACMLNRNEIPVYSYLLKEHEDDESKNTQRVKK